MKTFIKKILSNDSVLLILLFVLGLSLITSYGAHLDQDAEKSILYSNFIEFSERTHLFETFSSELIQEGYVPITENIDNDHGMCVYYPFVWIHALDAKFPYVANILWHVYIYIWCFGGVIALFLLCKKIFSRTTAWLSTLLFFFTPRLFAQFHYNNKDTVILSILIICFYYGYKTVQKCNYKNVLLLALFAAMLTNMKIIGAFYFGVIGIAIIVCKLVKKETLKEWWLKAVTCILAFSVFFIILTPATWNGVMNYIIYNIECAKNYRWNDYILFAGSIWNKNTTGMPRLYLPVTMAMTLPVGIILLALTGLIVYVIKLFSKSNHSAEKLYIWLYLGAIISSALVPALYAIVAGTPLYNGWRHFYFSYAGTIMLVAVSIDLLIKLKKSIFIKPVLFAYCGILFIGIIINHPYEYAYYNIIARNFVEDTYELDYWDMSVKQALESIVKDSNNKPVTIAACDNPTRWGIDAELTAIRGKNRSLLTVEDDWHYADYVILNPTYSYIYSAEAASIIRDNYELVSNITSYGNVICEIYKQQ